MKKITALFVILMMTVTTFGGCQKSTQGTSETKEEKLQVVSTIFASYDFAKQVAGDHADVTLLLDPGTEAHTYEPTPQDMITIGECDVFIYVGGENDAWVDGVLDSLDTSNMEIIRLMDVVSPVEEEIVEGMEEESHEGHDHEVEDEEEHEDETEWDEHVWTSPVNAMTIAESLEEVFSSLDAEHAQEYESRLETYKASLQELDDAFREVVTSAARTEVIFGDRFPLRYFVEEYGLTYYAAFPGCSSETEASAATLSFLIDKVKEDQIPVVFQIELSNGNIAKTIAEETGAKALTFYTSHNVSKEDFENGVTYTDLMWKNVDSLKEALN